MTDHTPNVKRASLTQRIAVANFLPTVATTEGGYVTYAPGWSDVRVADTCEVSVNVVRHVRNELMGKTRDYRVPNEVKEEASAVTDLGLHATVRRLTRTIETLNIEMGNQTAKLNALEGRVAHLERELGVYAEA